MADKQIPSINKQNVSKVNPKLSPLLPGVPASDSGQLSNVQASQGEARRDGFHKHNPLSGAVSSQPSTLRRAYITWLGQITGNRHTQSFIASFHQEKASGLQLSEADAIRASASYNPVVISHHLDSNSIQRTINLDQAKEAIEEAARGLGTDEQGIYNAIRQCSDRPTLAADSRVQEILRDELSGHELWKAQLLLAFGSEANFPAGLNDIFAATSGLGTDETRIFRALQALSAADIAQLNTIPGLRDMIQSELGGQDLQAAQVLLSGDYARQIDRHKQNVAHLQQIFNNMRTPTSSTPFRNTAEWLDPSTSGSTPRNQLYVLTPTHDSQARAAAHGQTDKRAYFGDEPQFPADSADYDAPIDSERNIHYAGSSVIGEHRGNQIWVMDPLQYTAEVPNVLVHEVQHDADRHEAEAGAGEAFKSPEESWVRFRTEFRAYWVDGRMNDKSAVSGTATDTRFDNERQETIFNHLYGSSPTDTYAAWFRPNYDNNTEVYGQSFQTLVHGYTRPEGVNLVNSPRIDAFYRQLELCSRANTNLADPPLRELEQAARALNADDQAYVNSAEALRIQEMMKDHLEVNILAQIGAIVNGGAAPAWLSVNIAQARQSIREAGAGWGTDEEAIFNTIGRATAAERAAMKTDENITRILHEELSGFDLWRAQLLLEFGAEDSWPPAVQEIWRATEGAGTDEARLRAALEGLTRSQVEAIARVQGIRQIIESELSGMELTTVNELLEGSYADAIDQHQQDMTGIQDVIRAGLSSSDTAWQAVCTRLNNPAQSLIYAMTPTHNSRARIQEVDQPGKVAFFGTDAPYPAMTGRYDSMPSQNRGIRFKPPETTSETTGRNLYIYNARNQSSTELHDILEDFAGHLP